MTAPTHERPPEMFGYRAPTEVLVPIHHDEPRRAGSSDERGLALGIHLAATWQLPLRLVHVAPHADGAPTDGDPLDATARSVRSAHPEIVAVDTVAADGTSVAAGLGTITSETSLVVIGTEHAAEFATTQSVAAQIVRSTDTMVMVAGPAVDHLPLEGQVVVPLDGSVRAESALDVAVELARSGGSELRVVTVISSTTTSHVADLRRRGEQVTESGYLRSVADRLREAEGNVHWDVIHGDDPIAALAAFVGRHDVRFVVAATHGTGGPPTRVLGSTCLGLVEALDVPVLVVQARTGSAELAG